MTFITGLTDTQIRATPLPVSGTITANAGTGTFSISAASLPLPTGAATSAKQPALGTAGSASADVITVQGIASGTAQPVSLASTTITGSVAVTGTFWQGTQPVSLATNTPVIATGGNVIGSLVANQSINAAQINGITPLMGNGITGTGSQRVTIASDNTAFSVNAVQSGTWNIGSITTLPALPANQSVNVAQMGGVAVTMGSGVTGTGVQRVVLATDVALPSGTNTLGTTTGPTLTKGSQGAAGYSVQALKDAGRTLFSAATVIGGVTGVTAEALLTMVPTRAGVASATSTSQAVTSGKTLRVVAIVASTRSSAATVFSGRVALRMNPSGAVTATSPIIAVLSMTQQAAALAEAGDTCVLTLPDGLEFSGTQQIGLTQVCSGTGGVVYSSIIGFEY